MTRLRRSELESLRDDLAGQTPSPTRDTITHLLEVVIGYPEGDTILDAPIPIWDKLRDVLTRLERVEADSHPSATLPLDELTDRLERLEKLHEFATYEEHDNRAEHPEPEAVDLFGNRLHVGQRIAANGESTNVRLWDGVIMAIRNDGVVDIELGDGRIRQRDGRDVVVMP